MKTINKSNRGCRLYHAHKSKRDRWTDPQLFTHERSITLSRSHQCCIQYFVVPDKINYISYSHIPGIQSLSAVYTNVDQKLLALSKPPQRRQGPDLRPLLDKAKAIGLV